MPLRLLLLCIGDVTRFNILAALAEGEPLPVAEIAQRVGKRPNTVSTHLALMRRAGIVVSGRGRLYRIPERFMPKGTTGTANFGPVVLHFTAPQTPG